MLAVLALLPLHTIVGAANTTPPSRHEIRVLDAFASLVFGNGHIPSENRLDALITHPVVGM